MTLFNKMWRQPLTTNEFKFSTWRSRATGGLRFSISGHLTSDASDELIKEIFAEGCKKAMELRRALREENR